MRAVTWLVAGVLLSVAPIRAQSGWTPLWNGKDLDGWTTWMQQPSPTSEVPGLKRDADGKYTEPIGSGRDPLNVFTVVSDVDGRPAIRISGEVFGELRTKRVVQELPPEAAVQVGREEVGAARRRRTRRATAGCCITCTPSRAPKAGPGHARSSCRSRNTTSAISTRSDRRSRSAPRRARARRRRCTTTIRPASGRSSRRARVRSGRCIKQPDNEKPTGEWNTVELIAFGDDAIHIVNGKVVMRLHGPLRIDTRAADAGHLRPDHPAVGRGGGLLPRHPDPPDYRDPGGVRREVVSVCGGARELEKRT